MTVQIDEVDMFDITRRRFLHRLFALPLLGSAIIPLAASHQNEKSDDRLLMVNGWVGRASDLR
jgi:hypothetical protein